MENPWPRISAAADVARSRGRRGTCVETMASSVMPEAPALAEKWRAHEAARKAREFGEFLARQRAALGASWAACVAAGPVGPRVGMRIATGTVHIWLPEATVAVGTVRVPGKRHHNTVAWDRAGVVLQSWWVEQEGPTAWSVPGLILPGTDMGAALCAGDHHVTRPGRRGAVAAVFGG